MTKDEALFLALDALEGNMAKWARKEPAITAIKAALEAKDEPVACWCHKCNENELVNGIPFAMTRMILCPNCGNKRCPKASDHTLQCTNSNEPNQAGSVYTTPPQQEAKDEPWEKFCDSNCVWTDHHPDCNLAERKPLTDEEIKRIWESLPFCNGAWETFARAIEAAHGIKREE